MSNCFFYLDESGVFEGSARKAFRMAPFLFGLQVSGSARKEISGWYHDLCRRYDLPGFVHAADYGNPGKISDFFREITERIVRQDECTLVMMRYAKEHGSVGKGGFRHDAAANRYHVMVQSLLEYLYFLYPGFHGKSLGIHLVPNSRVVPVPLEKKGDFTNLGLHISEMPDKTSMTRVLNEDILRSWVHRLTLDYLDCEPVVGSRSWLQFKTPSAKWCDYASLSPNRKDLYPGKEHCACINLVDNLAWLLRRWSGFSGLRKILQDRLDIDLAVGEDFARCRTVLRRYVQGDHAGFVAGTVSVLDNLQHEKTTFARDLYTCLGVLIRGGEARNLDIVRSLERIADISLSRSLGNHDKTDRILTFSLEYLDNLPEQDRQLPEVRRLRYRLLGHALRIGNHKGWYRRSAEIYQQMERLDLGTLTLEESREMIQETNRFGVTLANNFEFARSNRLLEPLAGLLERSRELYSQGMGRETRDPVLDKITGTMAQNFAFLAEREPDACQRAEELFCRLGRSFSAEEDKLRHYTNLLHLYVTHGRLEQAREMVAVIRDTRAGKAFFEQPGPAACRAMQFVLHGWLRYRLAAGTDNRDLPDRFSPVTLREWFGRAAGFHPFPLIHACLGDIAAAHGLYDAMEKHYRAAVELLPEKLSDSRGGAVLYLFRAQVYLRQALARHALRVNSASHAKLLGQAVDILQDVGTCPDYRPILEITENGQARGWFAPAWPELAAASADGLFSRAAAEKFVNLFPFNYK